MDNATAKEKRAAPVKTVNANVMKRKLKEKTTNTKDASADMGVAVAILMDTTHTQLKNQG